ncbi:MAG: hypothetical protein ACO3DS_09910 [Phycisphaerales bacterium]
MIRLRGIIMLGVMWAIGGAVIGGLIELILNLLPGSDLFLGVDMWPAALAIPGFLAGVTFAGVLALAEGRRSFEQLTLPRSAVWGALGGLALGVIVGLPLTACLALGLTSSGSAVGTIALARRGVEGDAAVARDRLEGGDH